MSTGRYQFVPESPAPARSGGPKKSLNNRSIALWRLASSPSGLRRFDAILYHLRLSL